MSTRTEDVINRLRELLLDGTITPGTHLHEAALAEKMGVSRTPVRDALRVLASENLLVYSANKGYVVRRFGIKEIFDVYDLRGVLEAMACRLAAERGLDAAVEAALRETLEKSEQAVNSADWAAHGQHEWRKLNTDFHFQILEYTENQYLITAAHQMRRMPRIHEGRLEPNHAVFRAIYSQERAKRSHEEHFYIFDAILARQGTRAENLMREHVFRNRETLRRSLDLVQPQSGPSDDKVSPEAGHQPRRSKKQTI